MDSTNNQDQIPDPKTLCNCGAKDGEPCLDTCAAVLPIL